MNIEFALAYIPRRMAELGYGDSYLLKFRHLVIEPKEKRKIDADNQYYLLVEKSEELKIRSEFGTYDLSDTGVNEQIYEHTGKLVITNKINAFRHLKFIQVIPKHN